MTARCTSKHDWRAFALEDLTLRNRQQVALMALPAPLPRLKRCGNLIFSDTRRGFYGFLFYQYHVEFNTAARGDVILDFYDVDVIGFVRAVAWI